MAQARARGVKSTLYVVYAGHGDVADGGWYLTLEDDRLSGARLMSDIVDRLGADQSHVIIDACHAYLLASARGPGGARRPVGGFVELEAASRAGRVGYVLSSSLSGESHEWSGFEAGVFSHEVRSGLYGAADADGDGRITYAEIAAFVARANQGIENDRFRPRVVARPPRDGDVLMDLAWQRNNGESRPSLIMQGPESEAHYLLEDGAGVRVLDFHGDGTTPVRVMRPPGERPLYLRRVADGAERAVPRTEGAVQMDQLPVVAARERSRGAAHHAFSRTFALAFDTQSVTEWSHRDADSRARAAEADATSAREAERHARWRRWGGLAAAGVAVGAGVAAGAFELWAHRLHDESPPDESQRGANARNARIDTRNGAAMGLAAGALVAGAAGAVMLLWPRASSNASGVVVGAAVTPAGAAMNARWRF